MGQQEYGMPRPAKQSCPGSNRDRELEHVRGDILTRLDKVCNRGLYQWSKHLGCKDGRSAHINNESETRCLGQELQVGLGPTSDERNSSLRRHMTKLEYSTLPLGSSHTAIIN